MGFLLSYFPLSWSYMNDLPVIGFPAVLFQSMSIHVRREICCILESVTPWGGHLQTYVYFWTRQKRKAWLSSRFVSQKVDCFLVQRDAMPLRKSCEVPSAMIWVCRSNKMLSSEMFGETGCWTRELRRLFHPAGTADIPIHCGKKCI